MTIRLQDEIYGRKHGMALTMDVFTPGEPNGFGLIFVVAGGWRSSHDWIGDENSELIRPFLERGYTVFSVVLCSMPRFTIPELLEDVHRAARFIRFHAAKYGINPEAIGVYGASAGGHLSLMLGFTGGPGSADAADPIDRVSSRVQAIAQFYGPTDFLNYGGPGELAAGEGRLADLKSAFDFLRFDSAQNRYFLIADEAEIRSIVIAISPVTHVSSASPPTLSIHGDADERVPWYQSELLFQRLQEFGVPSKLVVKPGGGHGWPDMEPEFVEMLEWFDRFLGRL